MKKNKDGTYSSTDKGIEKIVKLTENYKYPNTMKEKMQSLFDSKATLQAELIELGRELLNRKSKTVTFFEYPNGELAKTSRVDFQPGKNKKYTDYLNRLYYSNFKYELNNDYADAIIGKIHNDRLSSPEYKKKQR